MNVIDTMVMELKYKKMNAILGINAKYRKTEAFDMPEINVQHDIYDVVRTFEGLKLPGKDKLEKNAKLLLYIRKNLVALESFALDKPRKIIDRDSFTAKETAISFLINFLRFFNGISYLLSQGEFAPLLSEDKSKVELPLIYNVVLATRHGIYYTYDLLEYVLSLVKDFEKTIFKKQKSGDFRLTTRKGFSATGKLKSVPSVNAAALWNKKREFMKQKNKEKLAVNRSFTYKEMHTALLSEIEDLGMSSGKFLVEKFSYYINLKSMKNHSEKAIGRKLTP
jgi:hypothetical protein